MNIRNKKTVASAVVLALAVACGIWYWQHNGDDYGAETTSTSPSAQNGYKGDDRHTTDGQSNGVNQGGAVDNRGDTDGDVSNSGITSQSGLVTITGPAKDQVFTNGSVLRGRAMSLSRVQYRVVDDAVGVIAQGALDVVNGSFSGTMQFASNAKSGRVDIFTYSNNYNEENTVQIPVRFKE